MIPSKNAIDMIMRFESFSPAPYNDTDGNAHIGFGSLLHRGLVNDADKTTRWDVARAQAVLDRDACVFAQEVCEAVKVPLNQNQFDALVIWTYNCGAGAMRKSTWLKELNKKNYDAVPALMKLYNKTRDSKGKLVLVSGLVRRRNAEAELFETPTTGGAV